MCHRVPPCEVNVYKSDLSSGLIYSTPLAYLYTARVYTQGVLGGRYSVHCSAKWASYAGSARAVCKKMRLQDHPIVHRRSVHARYVAGGEAQGRHPTTMHNGDVYKSDLSSGLIDSIPLAYLYTARVYTQGALGGRCLVHCSAKWASHAGSSRAVCEKMRLQAHPIVHRRSVHARCAGVGDEGRGQGKLPASSPQAPGRPHPTSPHPTSSHPHLTLTSPSSPQVTLLTSPHPPRRKQESPASGPGVEGSGIRGSNSRPSAWEANALPTELIPRGKTKVRIVSEKTKGMRPDVKI